MAKVMDWDSDHCAITTASAYHSEHITPAMKHCIGSHAAGMLFFFEYLGFVGCSGLSLKVMRQESRLGEMEKTCD